MNTIKEFLEKWHITQRECAEHFQIPIRTVQEWSQGRRTPPVYTVRMLETIMELEEKMENIENHRKYRQQKEYEAHPEVKTSVDCTVKYLEGASANDFEKRKGESDFNGLLDFLDEIR